MIRAVCRLIVSVGAFLALSGVAMGQPPERPARVGLIVTSPTLKDAFIDGLREAGYRDGTFSEFAEVGGLLAYGPNFPDIMRRAAGHVARILRGARPAELPVERPTKFE